ncbi:MAG: hypothetical protein KC656_23310 [Myxococcales bacterium]|nr:hypothetical protein [Myxococcales bacterium]
MTEDRLRHLLQDGRTVDEPEPAVLREINELEAAGVVETSSATIFRCVRPSGSLPWGDIDPSCPGVLEYRGEAAPHHCPECGAEHWLSEDSPDLRARIRLRLVREGIEARIARVLERVDDRYRQMTDGPAWRVFADGRDVFVCVLDWATGSRYATRAFASTNPVVYLVVDWRRFSARISPGLGEVLLVYRLIASDSELERAVLRAPPGPHPLVAEEPPPPVWNVVRTPAPRVRRELLGARELVLTETGASLDGIEVLGRTRCAGARTRGSVRSPVAPADPVMDVAV